MEDTSIIFFGKPDGFESFGFKPQGVKSKVDHFEPSLKLESKHQDVFHTFTKNGYSYLELYSFAKAYNAGRDGIVIGVAIKSNKEIAVNDNNFKILNGLLSHFKKQALSGKMFNSTKISDMVSSFSLDDKIFSDFEFTADYSNEHGTLPLFLEDYESKINQISECRKSYSNVYVSNEKNIFNTKLNNRFLHKFGNKFYTISNSQLIEYKEPVRTKPTHTTKTSTDNVTDKLKSDILREKSKYVDLESKLIAFRKSSGKKIKALAITSAVLLLSLGAFFFKDFYLDDKKNTQPPSIVTSQDSGVDNGNQNKPSQQENTINIDNILDNLDNRSLLSAILVNIDQFEKNKGVNHYNAIVRDCEKLNIDHSYFKKPQSPTIKQKTVEVTSGMGINTLLNKFDNKYTKDEIIECNKDAFVRPSDGDPYLKEAGMKIIMPCTE